MKKIEQGIVGIEIDANEIRMAELKKNGEEVQVVATAITPVPSNAINDGMILNIDALSSAITNAMKANSFKSKRIVLGLSGNDVILRMAQFPKVPLDKMKNLVMLQAQEFLPIPMIEVELDYILGEEAVDDTGATTVNALLVAAKKVSIERFINVFDKAKLELADISTSVITLTSAVMKKQQPNIVVLVSFAEDVVNMIIIKNKNITVARSVSTSQWKENPEALIPSLAEEIRSSIIYHNMKNSYNPDVVDKVILIKNNEIDANMENELSSLLSLTVEEVSLFDEDFSSSAEKVKLQGAISLAMGKLEV